MIKKLTLLFLSSLLVTTGYAQTVVSTCTAPDSVVKKYVNDADYMALQRVKASNSNYKDSVTIPQAWTDTTLRALIAVHNAVLLPVRDTVLKVYNVHQYNAPTLRYLSLVASPAQSWMMQLQAGTIPTGNATLDGLISKYKLHIAAYTAAGPSGTHTVEMYSDSNYNISNMEAEFNTISGLQYFVPGKTAGTGSFILDTVTSNYVSLSYWYGWGDCPSGCLFYHHWNFRVDHDCKVTYMGQGGAKLEPITGIANIAQVIAVTVYPNPANDEAYIDIALNKPATIKATVTDITGHIVYTGNNTLNAQAHTITVPMQALHTGTYFYRITDEMGSISHTGKISKQ